MSVTVADTKDAQATIDQTSRFIHANKVKWPEIDKKYRTFSKEKAQGLSGSIKFNGLLNPITVRDDPDEPGSYIGVCGKHRWYASHKCLKIDLIEAKVVSATEAEAQAKTDAENLFRNALNPAQAALAIKRWNDAHDVEWKQWQADIAVRKEKKKAARQALGLEPKDTPSEADPVQTGPEAVEPAVPAEAIGEAPVAPPQNFTKHVAATTGVPEGSVKRSMRIAKAFDAEQLEAFDAMGTDRTWMETIAQIEQPARNQVVALVASGKNPDEAIAEVTGKTEIARTDGVTKTVVPQAEKELDDDAWVDFHCAEILALLPHKAAFRANAILYRQTADARATFKSKTKGTLADSKKAGANGGLFGLMTRLFSLSHPKHWLRCKTCQGNGVPLGEATVCRTCYGAGFVITTEKN